MLVLTEHLGKQYISASSYSSVQQDVYFVSDDKTLIVIYILMRI